MVVPAGAAEALIEMDPAAAREHLGAARRTGWEALAKLYLSEATDKTHVMRFRAKLGPRDRVQAMVCAHEHGLVEPGEIWLNRPQ